MGYRIAITIIGGLWLLGFSAQYLSSASAAQGWYERFMGIAGPICAILLIWIIVATFLGKPGGLKTGVGHRHKE